MATNSYTSEQMKSLSWQEQARKRPGMWIGSTGNQGVLHLLNEAIDNAVDEFTAGFGSTITIRITNNTDNTQTISVEDEGRGIPYGLDSNGNNTFTKSATVMFTGGKYDNESYKFNAGMNGSGLKLINVFSTSLELTSRRDGKQYSQSFSLGHPTSDISVSSSSITGTKVIFTPDPAIFGEYQVSEEDIIFRCKSIASLVPNCKIVGYIDDSLVCEFLDREELLTLQSDIALDKSPIFSLSYFSPLLTTMEKALPVSRYVEFEDNEIPYRISCRLEYYPASNKSSLSFCNTVFTSDMGSHDDAFLRVIRDSLKKITGYSLNNSQISTGLCYTLSVFKQSPVFRGQSKTRVSDETIYNCVYQVLYPIIHDALAENKSFIRYFTQLIVNQNKLIEETALKETTQSIKDSVRNNELPASLKIAYNCKPEKRELFLVEGKSSAGTVKEAALPYQEVLPLRGKVLNTAKSNFSLILKNQEIQDIFKSIGGMEKTSTPLRTYNVFILSDADPDGCVVGTTKIPLLSGDNIPISDLVDKESFWVYSCTSDGKIVPALAHNVRITKYVNKLYRITLDNGKTLDVTDNHPFMLRDGTYKRADELVVGMSLMPFRRRIDNSGSLPRPEIYIPKYKRSGRWVLEHRYIYGVYNDIKLEKGYHIHHIDLNSLNNTPENLAYITRSEHSSLHNELRKEDHSKIMSELHKQGVYKESSRQNMIAYNKSEKHRKRASELNSLNGKYGKQNSERISAYNKTQAHSEVVSARNKRMWENPEYRYHMAVKPCVTAVKRCLDKYGKLTPDLYDLEKTGNARKWENFLDFTGLSTTQEVLEFVENYNHTVTNIEIIQVDNEPVYDMTVDEYHNFATEAGVFVHNSHIYSCLVTLFVKLFPSFITRHNLYICHPPLFTATDGVHYEYASTAKKAGAKFRKKYKSAKFQILRNKGLGEMDAIELAPVLDPATRSITKVTISEDSVAQVDAIMGKSSVMREKLLEGIEGYEVSSEDFDFE